MNRLLEIIYSVALTIMFGTALCADGLAEIPGGFPIMFILIGIAGALVYIGNRLEDTEYHRERRRRHEAVNRRITLHKVEHRPEKRP